MAGMLTCLRNSRAAAAKQSRIYKQTGHCYDNVKYWANEAYWGTLSITDLCQGSSLKSLLPRPHPAHFAMCTYEEEEVLLVPIKAKCLVLNLDFNTWFVCLALVFDGPIYFVSEMFGDMKYPQKSTGPVSLPGKESPLQKFCSRSRHRKPNSK